MIITKLICFIELLNIRSEQKRILLFSVSWVNGHKRASVPDCPKLSLNGAARQKNGVCGRHLPVQVIKHLYIDTNIQLTHLEKLNRSH